MKKRKSNDFDSVAWIYDTLSRLIFRNSLLDAQKCFLPEIINGSDVLIMGGGTGELLVELISVRPACRICYIDASEKMIALSRGKVSENAQVDFIHGTEQDIPTIKKFDVVITNFYFDLFSQESLKVVIAKIQTHLKSNGSWMVTDFVRTEKTLDKLLLKVMYTFFRIVSRIEASGLPAWETEMNRNLKATRSAFFRKGFVKSVVYSSSLF